MLDKNTPENKHSHILSKNTSQTNTRRSFLIKGAMVAPLIAVSTSRPVWGADDSCINSGTLSGNLSNHGCQAVGRSPGWWWNNNGMLQWGNTDYSPEMLFSDIFGYLPLAKKKDDPIDKVLEYLGPSDSISCDMHAIAAILNFSHPGIAYSGVNGIYGSAEEVILAYQAARAITDENAQKAALVALKNELDNYDNTDGHDVFFNDL